MRRRAGTGRPLAAAVVAVLGVVLTGCGGGAAGSSQGGGTTTTTTTTTNTGTPGTPSTVTAEAASGGLSLQVKASPSGATAPATVDFTVTASEQDAHGALGYRIAYGDGATGRNEVPQFCRGGAGSTATGSWHLVHRYAEAGTYHVSVRVFSNCSADLATAKLGVVLR